MKRRPKRIFRRTSTKPKQLKQNKKIHFLLFSIINCIKNILFFVIPLIISYLSLVIANETMIDTTMENNLNALFENITLTETLLSQDEYLSTLHISENNKMNRLDEIKNSIELSLRSDQTLFFINHNNPHSEELSESYKNLQSFYKERKKQLQISHHLAILKSINKDEASQETLDKISELEEEYYRTEKCIQLLSSSIEHLNETLLNYYNKEKRSIESTNWFIFKSLLDLK